MPTAALPASLRAPARRRAHLLLAVLTAAAASLRLIGLSAQSLWFDELYTRRFALSDWNTLVQEGAARDVHPPGHMLFLHGWLALMGDSEWALRLPSALAGIVFVPLLYLLGRALGLMRSTCLSAAALATVGWFPIYYSQEGRAYATLLTLVAALALLAARAVHAHRTGSSTTLHMMGLTVMALAACYLHYFGALFSALLACVLWVVALRRGLAIRSLALACIAVAAGYAPWLATVLEQARRCGLGCLHRSPSCTLSWLVTPVHTVRNLIIVYPALVLLVAMGLQHFDRQWFGQRPVVALLACTFLLWDLVFGRAYYSSPTKEDLRAVAQRIATHSPPKQTPVVFEPANNAWLLDGCFELLKLPQRTVPTLQNPALTDEFWVVSRRVEPSPAPAGFVERERHDYRGKQLGNYRPPQLLLRRFTRDLAFSRESS